VRFTLGDGRDHLRRRIGHREPQRNLLLGGELPREVDVKAGQRAIRPRKIDDGTGMDQHDELLRLLGRLQRHGRTKDRKRCDHQCNADSRRDREPEGDQDRAAIRTHRRVVGDGGKVTLMTMRPIIATAPGRWRRSRSGQTRFVFTLAAIPVIADNRRLARIAQPINGGSPRIAAS